MTRVRDERGGGGGECSIDNCFDVGLAVLLFDVLRKSQQ